MIKKKLGILFLHYIRLLAKLQLVKLNSVRRILGKKKIKIIGITGSAGKTSTMNAVVSALKYSFKVKFSKKANTESGIPLNILGLQMKDFSLLDWLRAAGLSMVSVLVNWKNYDVYVVEMGIDRPEPPGNMGYLLRIIRPEIGIFTGVTTVHAMKFEKVLKSTPGVLERIADEKAKLISALPEKGFAILNFDDPLVKERKKLTLANVIGVGEDKDSRVKLVGYQVSLKSTKFKYQINDNRVNLNLDSFVLPKAYGINFGLVFGTCLALGVDLKKVSEAIQSGYHLPPARSSLIEGIKNTYIIDSSYNASPAAMETMLDLLAELGKKTGKKKIAVLGDMRELGSQSKEEHEKLADKALVMADQIITVGPEMRKYFLPKISTIVPDPEKYLKSFDTAGEAARYLKKNLEGGELILVKGSQNTIFLEIVVESLMADPSQAEKLLCRRGQFWKKRQKKFI